MVYSNMSTTPLQYLRLRIGLIRIGIILKNRVRVAIGLTDPLGYTIGA